MCSEVYEENEVTIAAGKKSVCVKTILPSKLPRSFIKQVNIYWFSSDRTINKTEPHINRFCGRVGGSEDSCSFYSRGISNMTCLTCDTDLCNNSNNLSLKIAVLLMPLIVLVSHCHVWTLYVGWNILYWLSLGVEPGSKLCKPPIEDSWLSPSYLSYLQSEFNWSYK